MSDSPITIRRVDGDNVNRVEALLEANGLPYQDVQSKPGRFFLAYSDSERIGAGGVEIYGSNGLLRSVVVTKPNRGKGYGVALCDALEDYARTNEVETLYLLTTTAEAFFRRRSYREIGRKNVPSSIRQTTEFAELCPTSATCMRKRL